MGRGASGHGHPVVGFRPTLVCMCVLPPADLCGCPCTQRHNGMDLLVSNLPAFEYASPVVYDLQTSREFTDWAPSIVYVIGVDDNLFCDFYWGIRPTFDPDVFLRAFAAITGATNVHTRLPECY